jgi:hypothetical protein
VAGDREHRGDRLGERTPRAPLREHKLREDHRERALEESKIATSSPAPVPSVRNVFVAPVEPDPTLRRSTFR